MKTGRKRKTGVRRSKTGKSLGEPHVVHPESVAVRTRMLAARGVYGAQPLDALAGFTLGQLFLRHRHNTNDPGSINQDQYHAGQEWASVMHRYNAVRGFRNSVKSPSMIMVSGGGESGEEPTQAEIDRAVDRFVKCYNALAKAARDVDGTGYRPGANMMRVCYGVCVENWPISRLREKDYGDLRIGLNAIGKVL